MGAETNPESPQYSRAQRREARRTPWNRIVLSRRGPQSGASQAGFQEENSEKVATLARSLRDGGGASAGHGLADNAL